MNCAILTIVAAVGFRCRLIRCRPHHLWLRASRRLLRCYRSKRGGERSNGGLFAIAFCQAYREELVAASGILRVATLDASEALDAALANVEAWERDWPAREQRAIHEGRALAGSFGRGAWDMHNLPS